MSGFGLIVSRDMRDLAQGAAFRILAAALLALGVALAAGAALLIVTPASGGPEAPDGSPACALWSHEHCETWNHAV